MTEMTKKALALSLKKLLEKKPLSKITVTDIAAECGINRHTFYYHFRDIYDLLEWIYVSETEEYILREGVPANWQESLTRLFQYCLENKKFVVTTYAFFQKDNMFQFIHKHAALIVGRIIESDMESVEISCEKRNFALDFYAYALEGIVYAWIKNGMKQKPEEIIGMLSAMIEGSGRITFRHLAEMR